MPRNAGDAEIPEALISMRCANFRSHPPGQRGGTAPAGRRRPGRWAISSAGLLAVAAALSVASCSTPEPRKRSFFGQAETIREETEPKGLNPLGLLQTCGNGARANAPGHRVLVSRPEFFTENASLMILALQEALAENEKELENLDMLLSRRPIETMAQARAAGRQCGALIVLWERRESHSLEMTLPYPARVPLRDLVQKKLCEFGDHSEQATILYLTILGLTAMTKNDYDLAAYYLGAAKEMDVDCLHLPRGPEPGGSTG